MVQLSHPYMTTGKTIALTMWTFVGKVMSLLFNTLYRFVIAFRPRSKCLFILQLQLPSQWFWNPGKQILSLFPFFPFYLPWSDGTECHNLSFLNVQFFFFFSFISTSWRPITPQYCSGLCHTVTWISHGVTCIPHPDPPSHLPLYPIPLGLPSAPGPCTCLVHLTWAGDLPHPR